MSFMTEKACQLALAEYLWQAPSFKNSSVYLLCWFHRKKNNIFYRNVYTFNFLIKIVPTNPNGALSLFSLWTSSIFLFAVIKKGTCDKNGQTVSLIIPQLKPHGFSSKNGKEAWALDLDETILRLFTRC